tara:strand:- start:8607 stop:9302 length:696 start_codon:yes stop_codon:yes gene_type:complete
MDFAFGDPETLADFILIGTLEILLLVIGILFALRINNWNLKRKEFQQTQDLLKLLIKDINENRDEIERDINQGKGMNELFKKVYDNKNQIDKVSAEDIVSALNFSSADYYFFAQSPAFTRLENSNLWEKISDELNSKIHLLYYGRIGIIKHRFAKHVEYATSCKLNYMTPNNLFDPLLGDEQKRAIVSETLEDFLHYLYLIDYSVETQVKYWEDTIVIIDEVISDIEEIIL